MDDLTRLELAHEHALARARDLEREVGEAWALEAETWARYEERRRQLVLATVEPEGEA